MMQRRDFLKALGLTVGGAALLGPAPLFARPQTPASALRLTILHTTDVHSWLEPMARGPHEGLGGVAARAAVVKKIREQYENVLLIDSGDILMGTPYFTVYEGEPDVRSMSLMGYDCAAIGNHDFDAGIDRLADLADNHANFPMLAGNYDFDGTPMEGKSKPWIVKELHGARIGILGMNIRLEGLVPGELFGDTRYINPMERIPALARHLRHEERCDFIICCSHASLGGRGDEPGDRHVIAEVPEIDLVLSGHNHQLFSAPEVTGREGAPEGYVLQSGWGGTHFGFLQFDLYARGEREISSLGPIRAHA